MADTPPFLEHKTVDVGDVVDALTAEPAALKAQRVHSGVGNGVTRSFHEGRNILVHQRPARGDDMGANVNELQAGGLAAQYHIVAHDDVASQGGVIGKHTVVAHHAVVCHMDVSHQQVVAAYHRPARGRSAAVQRAALPDNVVVAYLAGGVFSCKLQVLRDGGNDCARKDRKLLQI